MGDSDSKDVNVPKNVERQAKKLSPEAVSYTHLLVWVILEFQL